MNDTNLFSLKTLTTKSDSAINALNKKGIL